MLQDFKALLPRLPAAALLAAFGAVAHAQAFPSRPITIVVPALAGGAADVSLRIVQQKISDGLRQPVVIDYRPGGSGVVGAMMVKQATPDGYTLFVGHLGQTALGSYLIANLPFDPIKDFKPVTTISYAIPFLSVPAASPAKSVKELFAYAKSKPGGLFYGNPGLGTASHLLPEAMRMASKSPFTSVNYKGASAVVTDLLESRLDLYFGAITPVQALVDAGRLRILAVGARQRWAQTPGIPTMEEAGYPGMQLEYWFGLFAPAGTPDDVIRTVHAEFAKAMATPEVQMAYAKQGFKTGGQGPDEFAKLIAEDRSHWGKVIQDIGLKPE